MLLVPEEERLAAFRRVRDQIREYLRHFSPKPPVS